MSIYFIMVVSHERQKIGKRGRSVSFEWKGCPSASFFGTLLFFILLALGFPGEDMFIRDIAVVDPVVGNVQKASASFPLTGGTEQEPSERQPVVPFLHYTVERGETLSPIASRYSLRAETLISLNHLSDPREVTPGRILYIPSQDGARKSLKGEMTAKDLALTFSLSVDDLIPLGGGDYFLPGVVPGKEEIEGFWKDFFSYPLNSSVTGEYGESRDELTGLTQTRSGLDFLAYEGQPVQAIGEGVVSKEGFHGTYGWYMIVNHRDGFQSLYAHLDSFEVGEGASVDRGEIIGKAGNSGHTPGNLLFFSLFKGGETVDPEDYLF